MYPVLPVIDQSPVSQDQEEIPPLTPEMNTTDVISSDSVSRFPILKDSDVQFRTPEEGEENKLIEEFLTGIIDDLCPKQQLTIFREPKVHNAYPDLVLVLWNEHITRDWSSARINLTLDDFRVLECLNGLGQCGLDRIQRFWGEAVRESLERLNSAGVIYRANQTWGLRSTSETFAIERLIAVEAKVADWRKGILQAARNRWFASESYLLLGVQNTNAYMMKTCNDVGVGLLTSSASLPSPSVPATPSILPRSHGSWMFNEWVWRARQRLTPSP